MDISQEQMEPYLGLVASIAHKKHWKVRWCVDYDDLYQEGCIGLMKALERLRPDEPNARAYIARRISGEILDYLRRFPHAGRGNPLAPMELMDVHIAPDWRKPFDRCELMIDLSRFLKFVDGRERWIISGELRGMTQDVMARELHIDPSRISQLRINAVERMRTANAH